MQIYNFSHRHDTMSPGIIEIISHQTKISHLLQMGEAGGLIFEEASMAPHYLQKRLQASETGSAFNILSTPPAEQALSNKSIGWRPLSSALALPLQGTHSSP